LGRVLTGWMCQRAGWNRLDVPSSRLTLMADRIALGRLGRLGPVVLGASAAAAAPPGGPPPIAGKQYY
jgi:hypothetical protein